MMKAGVIILFLLSCFISESQTLSKIITDQEVIDFFLWKTDQASGNKGHHKIKRINLEKLTISLNDLSEEEGLYFNNLSNKYIDSLLSKDDREFIILQTDTVKSNWPYKVFKTAKLIIPKDLMKMKEGDDYYEFSLPVFTKDRKHCFLKQAYHCGFMCSDWLTLLFEKTSNGEWKLIMTLSALSS
jgi:hypothetical protein